LIQWTEFFLPGALERAFKDGEYRH
jgi:hypothetical protein